MSEDLRIWPHLCGCVDDRNQLSQVFAQQCEIQNAVLVLQALEKAILVKGVLLTVQLIVGPLALFVQGSNPERQSAAKTKFAAFLQGEGGALVESGISE